MPRSREVGFQQSAKQIVDDTSATVVTSCISGMRRGSRASFCCITAKVRACVLVFSVCVCERERKRE